MKKMCKSCKQEQLCSAIFGHSDSTLCGATTSFDFYNIEFAIEDFQDAFEFRKFADKLIQSKLLPNAIQEKAINFQNTFATLFDSLLWDKGVMTVEKFNSLNIIISSFNKEVCNLFNPPKWLKDSDIGKEVLSNLDLTEQEMASADLLYEEYRKQYAEKHS